MDDILKELLDESEPEDTQEDDTEEYHMRQRIPRSKRPFNKKVHYEHNRYVQRRKREEKDLANGETIESDSDTSEDMISNNDTSSFSMWVLIPVGIAGMVALWFLLRSNNQSE